jgi:hypothetical protein
MHARELVELAAVVAAQGPVLVRQGGPVPSSSIEQYWVASKCRMDRWGQSLKQLTEAAPSSGPDRRHAQWPHVRGVLEEILTGEVLTRVWTAVMCAHDRRRGTDAAEPVARSVMIGHLEARHRVLTLLVEGPAIDAEAAVKLNRLRRRTERWTDMLVGYLAGLDDLSEFAVDPVRARDFAEDLRYQAQWEGGRYAWPLVLASLRAAFGQGLSPISPSADLNAKIAASILTCFSPDLFDSTGLFRSLWLSRLTHITDDTACMIEELLRGGEHPPRHPSDPIPGRLDEHLRRFGG